MAVPDKVRRALLGRELDPFDNRTRQHVALVAFLAWIGLGADGLSSACYGPAEAFIALGEHTHLAPWLALATGITVFIIAASYNQVIDLFPSGGGGYKAATKLVSARAGLISGSALIVDYVLTIAISIASGGDALFSLMSTDSLALKLGAEAGVLLLLLWLNLRGMKESVRWLMPVFLGFVISHLGLIAFGIFAHREGLELIVPQTMAETRAVIAEDGWIFTAALLLRAYSLGAGTYTGIEAVSNNVNTLAEPRVQTGHWTMFYMALSLAVMAAGTVLIYLLWDAQPQPGQTLNAVTFRSILGEIFPDAGHAQVALGVVLLLEAGLLLVAANTGFLGGPAVLASMASDGWVPRQFRQLSSRLVTQNGVLLMGVAALIVLIATGGDVSLLVVLYSLNVFLTFSITLYGLCGHWLERRRFTRRWKRSFLLSAAGFGVSVSMLLVIVVEKFTHGAWVTLLVTGGVAAVCVVVRRHYDEVRKSVARIDDSYVVRQDWPEDVVAPELDAQAPTAVILIGASRGAGMRTLKWVLDNSPSRFRNYLFVSVGEVDRDSFDSERTLALLKSRVENSLGYFTGYCHSRQLAAESMAGYGPDPLKELLSLLDAIYQRFPQAVCFGSKLVFENENLLTGMLHNQLPFAVQRHLHLSGRELIIVPVPVPVLGKSEPPRPVSLR
jgi:amino acid transporter